jgi:hypothetical protein
MMKSGRATLSYVDDLCRPRLRQEEGLSVTKRTKLLRNDVCHADAERISRPVTDPTPNQRVTSP